MSIRTTTLILTMAAALAACGGGGGGSSSAAGTSPFPGNGNSPSPAPSPAPGVQSYAVTMSMVDSQGNSLVSVPAAGAQVKVLVKDATGAPLSGALVNVSTASTAVSLLPKDGSALTDANGVAFIAVQPSSLNSQGAFALNATVTKGAATATSSLNLQVNPNTSVALTGLAVGTGQAVSAFGSAAVEVKVSNAGGLPVQVQFSSTCQGAGLSSFSPLTATADSQGVVRTTYTDTKGCGTGGNNKDTVYASIVGANGAGTQTSLQIAVTPRQAANVQFLGASDNFIYVPSSGCAQAYGCKLQSTLTYKVVDAQGNGIPGAAVNLSLVNTIGGLSLGQRGVTAVRQVSDADGNVSVLVLSGNVPTPVRVNAQLESDPKVSAVSTALTLTTGITSQINFSLSSDKMALEGEYLDGNQATVSVIVSDRLGNPVPDGTAINFRTSAGTVDKACLTTYSNGTSKCSVKFTTSNPRADTGVANVLAYAVGEVSFVDLNGDNVWQLGEPIDILGDPFVDKNQSLSFDAASEEFIPQGIQQGMFSGSSTCPTNSALPGYQATSVLPLMKPNTCGALSALPAALQNNSALPYTYVRQNINIAMTTDMGRARLNELSSGSYPAVSARTAYNNVTLSCGADASAQQKTVSYLLRDGNPNSYNNVAVGSTLTVTATGLKAKLFSDIRNSALASVIAVQFYEADCSASAPKVKTVELKVTDPAGKSSVTWPITVTTVN